MRIQSESVGLIPATLKDREQIYEWMAKSSITPYLFEEEETPSWEEFISDYQDFYFNGSAPLKGGGYIIIHEGNAVGFISYASFHLVDNKAELDIWMSSESECGKGVGSNAIKALCTYLTEILGFEEYIILPSIKNSRAIRAYEKAGFVRIDMDSKEEIMKNCLKENFLEEQHDYDYIYKNKENMLLTKYQ